MKDSTPVLWWRPLVAGGLICGVLDINAAFVSAYLTADRTPMFVLRAVASALLGRDLAFNSGAWVGAVGLAMHFTVAFTAPCPPASGSARASTSS